MSASGLLFFRIYRPQDPAKVLRLLNEQFDYAPGMYDAHGTSEWLDEVKPREVDNLVDQLVALQDSQMSFEIIEDNPSDGGRIFRWTPHLGLWKADAFDGEPVFTDRAIRDLINNADLAEPSMLVAGLNRLIGTAWKVAIEKLEEERAEESVT